MPDTTPGGLHTPVTNIAATEATITQELVAEGADGEGAALPLPPDGAAERQPGSNRYWGPTSGCRSRRPSSCRGG